MNVYKVGLACERHYGNGYKRRDVEYIIVSAGTGEKAVEKAKKKVAHASPELEELHVLIKGVD